ncbi:MAG: hypothetical protein HQM12_22330 [SAR324 cluster bacterium]|nr:hypothetical protein [SAR324 cluster bacterium]
MTYVFIFETLEKGVAMRYLLQIMIMFITASFIISCSPPKEDEITSENMSQEAFELKDMNNLENGQTASVLANGTTTVPDIIFIEGFSNFVHKAKMADLKTQSSDSFVDAAAQWILNAFSSLACQGKNFDNADSRLQFACFYWSQFINGGLNNMIGLSNDKKIGQVAYLHWDSGHRIERSNSNSYLSQLYDNYDGNNSLGLITRFNELIDGTHNQGTTDLSGQPYKYCQHGCIIVTHSTGGLVADVLLAETNPAYANNYTGSSTQAVVMTRLGDYGTVGTGLKATVNDVATIKDKKTRIWNKITVVFEIASANGGVGLGDWIISDVANNYFCTYTKPIVRALFPTFECNSSNQPTNGSEGAGFDLAVSNARGASAKNRGPHRSNMGGKPVLLIAGTGTIIDASENNGIITSHLAGGVNDGLVALHSSCGADVSGKVPYESCHGYIDSQGYTYEAGWLETILDIQNFDRPFAAPTTFFSTHYPYIMTEEGHLSQVMPGITIQSLNIFNKRDEVLMPNGDWFSNKWTNKRAEKWSCSDAEQAAKANLDNNFYKKDNFSTTVSDYEHDNAWYRDCYVKIERVTLSNTGDHLSKIFANGINFSQYRQ